MRHPVSSFFVRLVAVGVALAPLSVGVGCTAEQVCTREAQCLAEEEDVDLESDSTNVCVAEYNGRIGALRANEEPECHALADALVAFDVCRASLDCNDYFDDADVEDACEDQFDDLKKAFDDVNGDECSALES